MGWIEAYTREDKPEFEDISAYVDCPFWDGLCEFIEETYSIKPAIEYSRCSGAPGWNVKYREGRALSPYIRITVISPASYRSGEKKRRRRN